MKKNKTKVIVTVIILVVLIAAGAFAVFMVNVNAYQKKIQTMEFSEVDISQIADGGYTGECDVKLIYAKVQVTVTNGKMTSIELLEHKNGKGKVAESIVDHMIEQNKIDVDAVSGATNSSQVIKKAVENALTDGNNER